MQAQNQAGYQDPIKTTARLAFWTLAWVATLALARFGPRLLWDSQPVASWAAVATNLVVGIGWIVAHAAFSEESMSCNERSCRMAAVRLEGVVAD